MNHLLRRSDLETHVRIVVISLAAGIAVVIGAINMKLDSHGAGHGAWASGGVIKASRQPVYASRERPFLR